MSKRFLVDVYAHNWGFLIPCKSGVVYTQQTGGVSCNQIELEGAFYPLQEPGRLLGKLQRTSYHYRKTGTIWREIKDAMHFDFELVNAPDGMPESDEGFQWIKLTKFEGGWGHMDWVEDLVGETLVLIYPNSD